MGFDLNDIPAEGRTPGLKEQTMSFRSAQECFDDAKMYVNAQSDPVMWDLVNGLSAMAQALALLQDDIERIRAGLHG